MKISVITICRNNERDIRPTLDSVVNQTYNNIEYIVVDGASEDSTMNIVSEYQNKINKIISEPDKGLYDAINKGIQNATGDVIGLIHAGDRLYDNQVIEKIANHFEKNDIDISYGHSVIVDSKNEVKFVHKSGKYKRWKIKLGWFPGHQSIYVRKEVFDRLGNYDLKFGGMADYDLFFRFFYLDTNNKIKGMDEFIHRFYLGGISTRSKVQKLISQKSYLNIWKSHNKTPPWYILPMKIFLRLEMHCQTILYSKDKH